MSGPAEPAPAKFFKIDGPLTTPGVYHHKSLLASPLKAYGKF